MTRDLYQRLYDDRSLNYGDAKFNRCPGVRYYPIFKSWLESPVLDLGCGRGQLVELMRKDGLFAQGIDQIRHNPKMHVGDITKIAPEFIKFYRTAVSIDVFEHLYPDQVESVLRLMKHTRRQVISVHTGSAKETGYSEELHVNQQSFKEWRAILERHGFTVWEQIRLEEERFLFLMKR